MSASQQTTNYGFPKFLGTDKPAWLVDFNGAMDDIDSTIKTVADLSSDLSGQVAQNTSDIALIQTNKAPITNPNFLGDITLNGENLANIFYPIGSIYMSTSTANPSTLFGGVWEAFAQGRTIIGAGISDQTFTAGQTGGESNHTLTIAEMPTHEHEISEAQYGQKLSLYPGASNGSNQNGGSNFNAGDPSNYYKARNAGGNGAHNNLPPYIVTYMWQRTA